MKQTINQPPAQVGAKEAAPIPMTGVEACPACDRPVKAGARFCGSCGAPINATKQPILPLCPRCGAPMVLGFCTVCGRAIVVNENPPVRVCPHCGSSIGNNANFCKSCGRKVV